MLGVDVNCQNLGKGTGIYSSFICALHAVSCSVTNLCMLIVVTLPSLIMSTMFSAFVASTLFILHPPACR